MFKFRTVFFTLVLLVYFNPWISFSQDETNFIDAVDITTFSHPDIVEAKRGGGWIFNQFGDGSDSSPINRLAGFTWSPIGDQAKIIYYSEVGNGDYFSRGQLSMVLVQFDLTSLQGYRIRDARLVLLDNWSGSDNEFALEISRILSGPDWIPFPDADPLFGHEWADGRSDFVTPNGFRIDTPTIDLADSVVVQSILDSNQWPEEIIQGACWAFRNSDADPWTPNTPPGDIGMIHEMRTWDHPDGLIRDVGSTDSVSSSLTNLVQGWVSGRYQNQGIVIHPSLTLTPFDLSLDSAVVNNIHGGWHNYNPGNILLAIDAEQVTPPISEPFQDDASSTAVSEWSLY